MNQTFGTNNETGNLTPAADGSAQRAWVTPTLERLSLKEALGSNMTHTDDVGGLSGS